MFSAIRNKLFVPILLIIVINTFGTIGYMVIEGWSFMDSLFMTVTTVTTVGYGEVHDLTPRGEIFTIVLLILGVGTILYLLSALAKIVLEGELTQIIGRSRLERRIKDLKDHYIVCGYGRMGKTVVKELASNGVDIIIIEKEPVDTALKDEYVIIEGDATKDNVLTQAGIERAYGLVSVLPTDAENLFVVLSARGLNQSLLIFTRAGEEGSEEKILRAGADRVVSPYHAGGMRIANMILKPAIVDFIEYATKAGNLEIQLEEVEIRPGSALGGKTLEASGIGKDLGIIIAAIKKPDGAMQFNPTSKSVMEPGDTLIALGEISKLKTLETMAGG
jgi:voltage-gated potassium channel